MVEEKVKKQALEGKRLNAFAMNPYDLTIIGLDTEDGKEHALYDERIHLPVNEALSLNIEVHGVIEPVIVRKNADRVEVIDGRQRVRAAREANERLKKAGYEPVAVPVMLRRGEDSSMLSIMISANEQRTEDEFKTKLKKLERYLALGRSEKDAAIAFGVSVQTILNWIAVMEAGPEVKKAMNDGLLTPSAAAKLASLPRADQAEAVAKATQNGAKKASNAKASRIKKEVKKGTSEIVPPAKKALKVFIKQPTAVEAIENTSEYREGFLAAVQWVLGRVRAEDIPGLSRALRGETVAADAGSLVAEALVDEEIADFESEEEDSPGNAPEEEWSDNENEDTFALTNDQNF
jgi:ParB family chromosome partitioning protein